MIPLVDASYLLDSNLLATVLTRRSLKREIVP
jgi:hypothetical protein